MDLGKELLIQEEKAAQAQASASASPVSAAKPQVPTSEATSTTTSSTTGKTKHVFISKANYKIPSTGVVADIKNATGQTTKITEISFSTITEWNNLTITIDGQTYKDGNYALFYDVGYAWHDPVDSLYHFSISKVNPGSELLITVDSGIILSVLLLDYLIQE